MSKDASPRSVLALLVVLCFGIRCFLAFRAFGIIDDSWLSDDSYIAFLLARNIGRGLGPYYTSGFTNGFQPLQVFLLAPLYRFFPETTFLPIRGALVLSAIFDALSTVVLYRWIASFSRSKWIAPLVTFAWVFSPYAVRISQNGLETSIAFFFILLSLAYSYRLFHGRPERPNWRQFAVLGLILGLAVLARIDGVFLLPALLIPPLWRMWRAAEERKEMLAGITAFLISAVLTYAPWMAYSLHYTGRLYQVSGSATRIVALGHAGFHPVFPDWVSYTLSVALRDIMDHHMFLGIYVAVLAALLLFRARSLTRSEIGRMLTVVIPALLFSILLFCAYTFYMFAFWYFSRYLYPLILLALLLLAVLFDSFAFTFQNPRSRTICAWILALSLLTGTLSSNEFRGLFTQEDTNSNGYMDVGLWARNYFPPGTRIGSSQTGALAYFADNLKVYNLDGVVNEECYRWLVQKKNMEYIRKEKIEYILGWPSNIEFLRRYSAGWSDKDLQFIGIVPGIRSWGQQWLLYRVNFGKAPTSSSPTPSYAGATSGCFRSTS